MGVPDDEGGAPPAASAFADFPDNLKFNVNDSGGEVSASIDETNKMRAALGLKPLKMEDNKETKQKERDAHRAKVEKQEKEKEAAALREKLTKAREERVLNEKLRKTKTLGQVDDPTDDSVASWVNKSRTLEEKTKQEEKEKAERMAKMLEAQDDDAENSDDEDGDGGLYSSKDLAGLKVKHSTGEMNEGDTVILTLADSRIITEDGDLNDEEDELLNVRANEEKKRKKAREEAKKTRKPLFGEDEEATTILEKYDEKKPEEAIKLGDGGVVDEAARKRQEEIRRKLKEGAAFGRAAESLDVVKSDVNDFYTKEEMEKFVKPKKMKKKLRKKKKDKDEDKVDLDALEAEARAAEAAAGKKDHGSRASRSRVEEAKGAAEKVKEAERRARYETAVSRSNEMSRAKLLEEAEEEGGAIGDDEDELAESLARARRLAAKPKSQAGGGADLSGVASAVSKRREESEAGGLAAIGKGAEGAGGGGGGGGDASLVFTTTTEFVRNISAAEEAEEARREAAAAAAATEAGSHMDVDGAEDGAGEGGVKGSEGGGVKKEEPSDEEDGGTGGDGVASITGERLATKGMAGALALMREKGELNQRVDWAGRTNDKKKGKVAGLHETDERFKGKEVSLIHKDEFGRVLTPKEAFRNLCYRFHGITPSKNKQEKKLKQIREELNIKKMAAGDTPTQALDHMKREMTAQKTPFLVLSGSVKAGQISDASSGFGLEKEVEAPAPTAAALAAAQGGGQTPLMGDKKVEAMYGIKRPPGGGGVSFAMPPPPSKKSKKG